MHNQRHIAVILSAPGFLSCRVLHVSRLRRGLPLSLLLMALSLTALRFAPAQSTAKPQQLVILDTDIGDDIDDAFALALVERSPELHLLGITTAFGDTTLRAQLTLKFLDATGFGNVPVAAGVPTPPKTDFTQTAYAQSPEALRETSKILHATGPDFILDQIRQNPGQITLIAIGPQTNLGAAIDEDPATFRKLKRIVMMGGSVDLGYEGHNYADPEWNILCDIPAAKKVFASGVPIFMMPLDSTLLKFPPQQLKTFFAQNTALTNEVHTLESQWRANSKWVTPTPTLFDPMAVAYTIDPAMCPAMPMHITVDEKGYTRRGPGTPNANVCLKSDSATFFRFYMSRFTTSQTAATK